MLLLPLHVHAFSKKNHFSFFPHMSCKKKWKLGRVVAKKQPQVVKIPPHMVHRLYCEKYLSIQSMLGEKRRRKTNISPFLAYMHAHKLTFVRFFSLFFQEPFPYMVFYPINILDAGIWKLHLSFPLSQKWCPVSNRQKEV